MCTRLYFPIGIHPSPLLQSRQDLPAKSRRSIVHAISRSMSSSTFVSHSSRNFEKNLQVESRRGSNRSRVRGRSAKARGKGWLFHGSPGATGCPFPFRFPGIRNYFEFACFRRGILRGRGSVDEWRWLVRKLEVGSRMIFMIAFFFLSIRFYWFEDISDVSAHEYRRLNMRQFSSCALWFDMWT